jgi:RNA polymerase sigma-B factor
VHDLDSEIEDVAAALARAVRPEERADLQERLVLLALPQAEAIARRYAGRGIETDDLLQVARTALVKAAHRYRAGQGSGFGAFMAPTVSGEIKRWFRDHGWAVRPPRRVQELRSRLVSEEEEMRRALARDPRDDELAEVMGVTLRDIDEARLWSGNYHAASLDALTPSGTSLVDHLVVSPCPTDTVDLLAALGWAVSRLTERQQRILRLRFVDELTQGEIGGQLGVSQMQVSRLLRDIVEQLRRDLDGDAERAAPQASGRP